MKRQIIFLFFSSHLDVAVTFEMAFRRLPLKRITGAEQRGLLETKLNLIAWIWSFGLIVLLFVRCCVFASAKSCRKVSETYSCQGQVVMGLFTTMPHRLL